ncbi:hypothetical protein XF24_00702 [candidate division SR1 bacterium Aalborg_AAW-1]|nr:hypothetical protein XF24_00702 [candidate division SR1 bacterium Aalborg_AAW-1]
MVVLLISGLSHPPSNPSSQGQKTKKPLTDERFSIVIRIRTSNGLLHYRSQGGVWIVTIFGGFYEGGVDHLP